MLAPIVLFTFNRPWHTQQTLEALEKNELASDSVLYVYADGAKEGATEEQLQKIEEVRQLIRKPWKFKEIHIVEREQNYGLAENIVGGVTEIVNQYGRIIVLEDDIVTSRGFLKYMNDALNVYEDEERVMHITAHTFPLQFKSQSDTYFLKYVSPWGWATWSKEWRKFEISPNVLYRQLMASTWYSEEDYNSFFGNEFMKQLIANSNGDLKTWAVKWHTSIYLHKGLCLFPKYSLVNNIGFDGSGTNCGDSKTSYNLNEFDKEFINVEKELPSLNQKALKAFANYYNIKHNKQGVRNKIYGRLKSIILGQKK